MAMELMDVGRGSRRFRLPSGHTIGEGWVRDPVQAYNFAKAGIKPEFTGEYEGMHGEGITGARPTPSIIGGAGRTGGAAMAGLRSAMSGDDDAPGASLMRRLTSSPDMAARYGLIARPEDLDANSQMLQSAARGGGGKTAIQDELEQEDILTRRGMAMQSLQQRLAPGNEDLADLASERGFARMGLPEAAHRHQLDFDYEQQALGNKAALAQLLEQIKGQTEIGKAQAAATGDIGRANIAAQTERDKFAMEGLRDAMARKGGPTDAERAAFERLSGVGQRGTISSDELARIAASGQLGSRDPELVRQELIRQGYNIVR